MSHSLIYILENGGFGEQKSGTGTRNVVFYLFVPLFTRVRIFHVNSGFGHLTFTRSIQFGAQNATTRPDGMQYLFVQEKDPVVSHTALNGRGKGEEKKT